VVSFDKARRLRELGAEDHAEMWTGVLPAYYDWDTFLEGGDFWVVRSGDIKIQARYVSPNGWITGLAVAGPFLQGHKFEIYGSKEDGAGWGGFVMTWDGRQVMRGFPSAFSDGTLIQARYADDRFYQDTAARLHQGGRDNWRSRTELRLVEMSLPRGTRLTLALGAFRGSRSWARPFIDVFLTMPAQASGQDGHCGRGIGDFSVDWWGSAVPARDNLFSQRALLLLAGETHVAAPASGECAEGGVLEDTREPCRSMLLPAEADFGLLFLDACMRDVCRAGQGLLEHYEAFAKQAFHEYAAEARGRRKCSFTREPVGVGYYWDPLCRSRTSAEPGGWSLGCGADGKHHECRLCGGRGSYANITCPGNAGPAGPQDP